jgi:ATP-binding cassette subfamily B (MDR/TAP) protein 1
VALVQATTGPSMGQQCMNSAGLVAGIVIAFSYSWQLSLVVIGTVPFMAVAGLATMKLMMDKNTEVSFSSAGAVSSEAIDNIRTVATLGLEDVMAAKFVAALGESVSAARRWVSLTKETMTRATSTRVVTRCTCGLDVVARGRPG